MSSYCASWCSINETIANVIGINHDINRDHIDQRGVEILHQYYSKLSMVLKAAFDVTSVSCTDTEFFCEQILGPLHEFTGGTYFSP
ncbi:hypothetical protein PV327_002176 [Microctonus hyperodae]|uniref:Uncharacterized protein n=1 Tax=Microctonus hyperodae TaxID=165561 RepID=A0AA39KNT6_MICHY|nr:hypothetical protein PV327_002176 [Microctonus hyperodae]